MSDNKDNHGFSVSVAQEIGVNRAIMLQHFRHLQIAFVDGEKSATDIWVKRSRRALTETYPYLSEKEIRGCLDRLERDDYIRAKVDNTLNYDRTKSYQLSKRGWELLGLPASAQKANREQKASDKRANGFDKRANDNVTKGPMNIGSCSSVVTSIVQQQEGSDAEELLIRSTTEFENVTIVEKIDPKAEKKESPKVALKGSYSDPAPRRFEVFDIDKEERMFLGAEDAMERFARETGTPRDKMYFEFQDAVKAFTADQKTTGYNYNNAIDYRKHFFNLVRRKAEIARSQPGASAAQQRTAPSALPLSLQTMIGK